MANRAEHDQLTGAANQMMRRLLHELEGVRVQVASNAEEVRNQRDGVRAKLAEVEREARERAQAFSPPSLGEALLRELRTKFDDLPPRRAPESPPESFNDAQAEWNELAPFIERGARQLVSAKVLWDNRMFKRRRSAPTVPEDLWRGTERLAEIHAALPALRERFIVQQLDAHAHLNDELAAEIQVRTAKLDEAFAAARQALGETERSAGLLGTAWSDPGWMGSAPAERLQRVLRIGELQTGLPADTGLASVPSLLEFPFQSGLAISADVHHRKGAADLARSIVMRVVAAVPPGDVRFVFFDPVSLGQAVAEFRHLSEFDARLVDVKTWTSERDIESRLDELSDHLEVVISTYLRGQFESIDEYNRQAGEVAEPYRVLVIFDYPEGFTSRSAKQLLSLIENGPRCGVHTVLLYDPSNVKIDRLIHSMQQVDLTGDQGRISLAEPIGTVELDFLPDAAPPVSLTPEGRPTTPFAQLLFSVGAAARSSQSGPVTFERVFPIVNKLIAAGRSAHIPQLHASSPPIDPSDRASWWSGISSSGAFAPIGRAGAQDVAALYFSSTEIAGGAIVVGLPRSGKSTALHAAILSLATIYPPEEIELYLIDSKHGVEFKVYERLPHARLVSINSEREFSVSVLQSLDGEIKRRAEMMKRHTTGRANITEYRSAGGERLPRIVLFMDEFHEVFEEDDAVGQQAFQAFSNIVRQGPFAGVHAVVASQTLSMMPAMDRDTLSLLPMRVAFMCNEGDADLVMGHENREVKALAQQGEGIFNPTRGESSHNKPFRGTYIGPDERAALLVGLEEKAQRAAFARRPKVFDGDTLAERLEDPAPGSSTRPVFALGEPFNLQASAAITLRRGRGGNLLLVGVTDDGESADRSVEGAVHSFLTDGAAEGVTIHVVDFIGDAEPDAEALDLMSLCRTIDAEYRRASGLREALVGMRQEIGLRREASDYSRGCQLLVLNGLQRALDLTPAIEYAQPDEPGQELAQPLALILREGPEFGCHAAVVVDRVAQFDRRLGRDMLKEFDWRIAGNGIGPDDISAITESHREGEIRQSQLLLVDYAHGKSQRVRAYPRYTTQTIQPVAARRPA